MCLPKVSIPIPDPVQEAKQPDFAAILSARKKASAVAGGTWLTGPSGVSTAMSNFGAPTLLGSVGNTLGG